MVEEPKYEKPDPSLLASIEHESEKLGYLVAQVEEMFSNRVRAEHREITLRHTTLGLEMMKAWLAKELDDEAYAEHAADLAQATTQAYDQLKFNFSHNISHLNQMVLESIERGKKQQNSLNAELNRILNPDED